MTREEIECIFTYHAPFGNQPQRYETLRAKAKELALLINESCPESREKSLAITQLQSTIQWANAAIGIREKAVPHPTSDPDSSHSSSQLKD